MMKNQIPGKRDFYTLVLDLDETLVHYFELDGSGYYDMRPGCIEFLTAMNQLGATVRPACLSIRFNLGSMQQRAWRG